MEGHFSSATLRIIGYNMAYHAVETLPTLAVAWPVTSSATTLSRYTTLTLYSVAPLLRIELGHFSVRKLKKPFQV
jgi:hypothetical protein